MNDPVLIAGAGPVGLTLAMALRRRNVAVRIVDQAAARTDKSKALVLWPRTLEMLDIQGCSQAFVAAGLRARGARILSGGDVLVHVDLSTARSVHSYALMIPQSETERLLEEQLETLGTRVERRATLRSFVDDGDGVTATLAHADGREEHVRAAWLAGCDGAHSTVRHALRIPFEGDTMPSDWALADLDVDGDLPRDELTICLASDGVLALFPIGGARCRVIADMGLADAQAKPSPTLAEIQALLDRRGPPGLRVADPVWMSRFRINERKVGDYRHGRVFLAGDAAHVHSPAGGQGMNTGMQDAFNLAWKLALAWHAQASPALLDTYSPERSAIGDQVLRNAGNLTRVALLRNPVLQDIRSLAAHALGRIPTLRQMLVDQLTEIDLRYRDGDLVASAPGAARRPAGGERAPDVALRTGSGGAARLYDALRAGRFVVMSVGAPHVELPEASRAIAVAVEAADASDGYEPGHAYLIRPDAYVALSTGAEDTSAIHKMLARFSG